MVIELKEVLQKVEQLKEDEQRAIANLLQQEIAWEASFRSQPEQLDKLAKEALYEYRSGKTKKTDW